MNPMYWCIILENTLRNAIDACEKVEHTKFCALKINTIGTKIAVNVKNTYNGMTNMEHDTYLTTKVDSVHGYGILNVKKVVELFHGWLKIETYKEGKNHIFSVNMVLETHC